MRRTLHGRRQSSLGLIYEAIDGFALLPRLDDVPWDSWLKAALFEARSLGADFAMIARRFADMASATAVARLGVAAEAMNRIDDLSQCRIAEVSTSHGIGFVETLIFRDTAARGLLGGLYGAPRMTDHQVEYGPKTNLAQLTVNLADALDASGTVVTNPISQDQLAATSFSLTTSGSYLPTAGASASPPTARTRDHPSPRSSRNFPTTPTSRRWPKPRPIPTTRPRSTKAAVSSC